jgi:hypothetical protein
MKSFFAPIFFTRFPQLVSPCRRGRGIAKFNQKMFTHIDHNLLGRQLAPRGDGQNDPTGGPIESGNDSDAFVSLEYELDHVNVLSVHAVVTPDGLHKIKKAPLLLLVIGSNSQRFTHMDSALVPFLSLFHNLL